jgi:MoaA/NifB/PqqE/SkfB family radical SAM enzyme
MYRDWTVHGYPTCYWSAIQAVITPNGKVWACLNKRSHKDAELGDLTKQSFEEIWTNAPIQYVNNSCRVMCRGHVPNLTLDQMMRQPAYHRNFI